MHTDTTTMHRHAVRKAAIRSLDPAAILPRRERHLHTVEDLKQGAFLRFGGTAYKVTGVSTYMEMDEAFRKPTGESWQELTLLSLADGTIHYLECEKDDELEIYLTIRSLRFPDLRDDAGEGIDKDDLEDLVEEEDPVFLGGKKFSYDDDYAARYKRGGEGRKGELVRFYDFCADDGECITIEAWKDGDGFDHELFLSRQLGSAEIEIISLGG